MERYINIELWVSTQKSFSGIAKDDFFDISLIDAIGYNKKVA